MQDVLKSIVKQMLKTNPLIVCIFIISLTLSGMVSGFGITEMLRRITQAIWAADWNQAVFAFSILLVIITVNFSLGFVVKRLSFRFTKLLAFNCEDHVYHNYLHWGYWPESNKREVFALIKTAVPGFSGALVQKFQSTYQTCIIIISGIIYGMVLNPPVLSACILLSAAMVLFSQKSVSRAGVQFEKFAKQQQTLYGLLWEQLENREAAAVLNTGKVLGVYEKESKSFLQHVLKVKKTTNGSELFSKFASTVLILIVSLIGGQFVLHGSLSFSDLLALIILIPNISSGIFSIPYLLLGWNDIRGQADVINTKLQSSEYKYERSLKLNSKISSLSIRSLELSYPERTKPVLKGIALDLTPKFYSIAGPSGCGKSTLLKVLAMLIPYRGESISVNGIPLDQLETKPYWEHVTYVGQDPFILPDTLLYNITMTDQEPEWQRVEQVIEAACLKEFLEKQTKDLHSVINPDCLSKGEIQRINIARALYKHCELLLLDEVVEAIDPDAEKLILESVKEWAMQERMIVLCVSHRTYPLSIADEVIFMQDGVVEAVGKHEKLLEQNSEYRVLIEKAALEMEEL